MKSNIEKKDDITIVRMEGRLDASTSSAMETKIMSLIESGNFKILLDFGGVEYLSSAGMRLMLSVSKKLKQLEGKVVACHMNSDVMEVVRMAGFDKVIEIYSTEKEGCAHLM